MVLRGQEARRYVMAAVPADLIAGANEPASHVERYHSLHSTQYYTLGEFLSTECKDTRIFLLSNHYVMDLNNKDKKKLNYPGFRHFSSQSICSYITSTSSVVIQCTCIWF